MLAQLFKHRNKISIPPFRDARFLDSNLKFFNYEPVLDGTPFSIELFLILVYIQIISSTMRAVSQLCFCTRRLSVLQIEMIETCLVNPSSIALGKWEADINSFISFVRRPKRPRHPQKFPPGTFHLINGINRLN